MASLVDLLRYKEEVDVKHPRTGQTIKKVWVRVLGDYDLNKAYKASRIVSSEKRAALRNPETDDYKDEVLGILELSRSEQEDVVKTARLSNFISEANAIVERPDLPKLEELSLDADAPTLEELEKLDAVENKEEEEHQKRVQEYINQKQIELDHELSKLSDEELIKLAQFEISNVLPFGIFMAELNDYKLLYGVFRDKLCKEREFDSIEDIKNTPQPIKDQLLEVLNKLELGQEEIKN